MMNIDNFLTTLPIMGLGMLGIFIVTAVIILITMALNKITKPKESKEKEES
jgi:hypothetical protein